MEMSLRYGTTLHDRKFSAKSKGLKIDAYPKAFLQDVRREVVAGVGASLKKKIAGSFCNDQKGLMKLLVLLKTNKKMVGTAHSLL